MRVRVLLVSAAVLAGTVSCSSSVHLESGASSASTPSTVTSASQAPSEASATQDSSVEESSSAPARNAQYDTVEALMNAAVAAGYSCPSWSETDEVRNAAESGSCSDSDVFCIYATETSRDRQVQQTKDNNDELRQAGVDTGYVLFGPNWSILVETKTDADLLRTALGGIETQ